VLCMARPFCKADMPEPMPLVTRNGCTGLTSSAFEIQLYPRSLDEICILNLKNDYFLDFYMKTAYGQSGFVSFDGSA
ncbi:MAG TPA: hypothetical protein VIM63_19370, partial [Rhodoferax sp.]